MPDDTASFMYPHEGFPPTQVQAADAPTEPPPSGSPRAGRIGKYEIVDELGEGGMGRVYKAFDPELKRYVAVKVLKPGTGLDDVIRFRGEAELVACLEHANIVKVHDIGMDHQSQPYLVLEYIDGGSLADQLRKHLPRPREAAEKIETLARAVHEAHRKGIVHRDLKPANVLVTKAGTLKVSDFGLGKRLEDTSGRTRTGDVFGTPNYMAPEQACGDVKATGPATDVYALGTILYEMLTGRPPFAGAKVWDVLAQVQYADPAAPSLLIPRLPRDLSTICLKCLEKSPKARYESALELADDLRRWLNSEPIVARPTPWWERLWRRVRRRPKEAAVALAVLVAAATTVGFITTWRSNRAEAEAQATRDRQTQEHQQDLNERHAHSLAALSDIRDLALKGEWDEKAQDKLRKTLTAYYRSLHDRGRRDGLKPTRQFADEMTRLAELIGKTGIKDEALEVYDQAGKVYEQVAADDPAVREQVGLVHLEVGRILIELGRYDAARAKLAEAGGILADICKDQPQNLTAASKWAEVHHLTGELMVKVNKPDAALAEYTRSIELRERVFAGDPKSPVYGQELARGYGYRGDVYLDRRQLREADQDFWKSYKRRLTVEKQRAANGVLADNPDLQEAQFQLARGWANFARYQTRNRAFDTALYFQTEALQLQQAVFAARGSVSKYRSDLADSHLRLGDLCIQTGDVAAAGGHLKDAQTHFRILHARNPDDVEPATGLGECHLLTARLRVLEDKWDQARPHVDEALRLYAGAERGDRPARGSDCYALAAAYALRAHGQSAASADHAKVMEWLGRAVEANYRDRHPEDMKVDCAFQAVKDDPAFQKVVGDLGRLFSDRSPR